MCVYVDVCVLKCACMHMHVYACVHEHVCNLHITVYVYALPAIVEVLQILCALQQRFQSQGISSLYE